MSTSSSNYPCTTDAPPSSAGLCNTAAIEMSQPGGMTYCCFDSKFDKLVTDNFFGQVIYRKAKIVAEDDPYIDRVPEWLRDWHTGFQMMVDGGAIVKAGSIEELEKGLGLSEGILINEVNKWNEACEKSKDYVATYKYPPQWLIPIDHPLQSEMSYSIPR